MSKLEAEIDGIQTEYDPDYGSRGKRGTYLYKIPCAKCGEIVKRVCYTRKITYLCDYCKATIRKKKEISKELLEVKTPKEKQFDKALNKIRNQVCDFNNYEKAIKIAETRKELYGSIPETMVAIELLKLGYSIIPQQKIKKYKVDFAIPKEKIVVEVDGLLYHKDVYKGEREAIIQLSLGLDWKIIHVPAEKIAKDISKIENIINVLSK